MRQAGTIFIIGFLFLAAGGIASPAADAGKPAAAPDFQEVYDLIRTNLAGVSAAELNRTAVDALVSALRPQVFISGADEKKPAVSGPVVNKSSLFDGPIAYVQVAQVAEGLPEAVRQAYDQVSTNRINGVVIDLRFAGGDDYAAAGRTADLFLKTERPLLDWGSGAVRSKEKPAAITPPVAVLVNGETSGAAEALAAVFRETGAALIIGSKTAGQAMIAQEYPLKNGQKLRIATAPVKVGQGTALTPQGVKPDLAVNTNIEAERAYLADPFKERYMTNLPGNSTLALEGAAATNRTRRARFGEAELVRERREGLGPEMDIPGRGDAEPEKPVVRDPALARALDVLKGLAVVRQSRS